MGKQSTDKVVFSFKGHKLNYYASGFQLFNKNSGSNYNKKSGFESCFHVLLFNQLKGFFTNVICSIYEYVIESIYLLILYEDFLNLRMEQERS